MQVYDYDLLVIGAGSGGVRAARVAAQLGAKVAIAEENRLGGTCVNLGCVPKKLLFYAAQYRETLFKASGFGWDFPQANFDWSRLIENKNTEIARLNGIYQKLLANAGVTILNGRAQIADPHTVEVAGTRYSAARILLAVGGRPRVPEFPGCEYVITSDDAFYLPELPRSMMIVGGGYVGVEFAGIFNSLGVETHLCHRSDMLLKGFDDDVRCFAAEMMAKKGIHLHFGADIERIEKLPDNHLCVHASSGRYWQTEQVMYATGRQPKTDALGLENTAVVMNDDGTVPVDEFFQTAEPSIYAVGDVIGRVPLTPVAIAEGVLLANHLYGERHKVLDYDAIPTAAFSQPPIAMVGLTESRARETHAHVDVYKAQFKPMQFSLSGGSDEALLKLLVDRDTDKVLGCHMVGPEAPEIIQGLAVALTAGVTKKDFDATVGIHPTLAEEFVSLRRQ